MKIKDITGRKFSHLTAVSLIKIHNRKAQWECVCDCGATRVVSSDKLLSGRAKSCGCKNGTHKLSHTKQYKSYHAMIARCHNPKNKRYKDYGGRGIVVCQRWRDSYEAFIEDMGERPIGKTIDRINNDGNYEPGNCRWATPKEQQRNTRTAPSIDLIELSRKSGISIGTLRYRYKNNKPLLKGE